MKKYCVSLWYYDCSGMLDESDGLIGCEHGYEDFDTFEEAYECFCKIQSQERSSFFTGIHENAHTAQLQIEECEDFDDYMECIDIKKECSIINPKYDMVNKEV